MKAKKYIIPIVLVSLLAIRGGIMLWESQKTSNVVHESALSTPEVITQVHPDATLSKMPEEAVTSQNSTNENDLCQSMRSHYQNLNEIKKVEKTSMRFVNVHKKVDGITYRTRFFYKDASEQEIPTYLLYREDQNEEEHLIETSPYKKGPEYLKIEKAIGTIIYTEEGVNIGADQDLFLHYENKELKDLQGINSLGPEENFIECRF